MKENEIWEKYYITPSENADMQMEETLYASYVKANRNYMNELAIITADGKHKYTHGELLNMVDLAAGGFAQMGIGRNDRVGILLNNTIEMPVTLLALSKLGAISVFVNTSKSIPDIAHAIQGYGLCMIIMDEAILEIEPYINPNNLTLLISNQTKSVPKEISFSELYKKGIDYTVQQAVYEPGRPAVIINSSGTTGVPKPIVHTDYSMNMAVYKMMCTDYPLKRENIVLDTIPPFIGLGLVTTLYTGLLSGTKVVLLNFDNPSQSAIETTRFMINFPSFRDSIGLDSNTKLLVFAAPIHFRILCENIETAKDFSYIGAMLAGGSKMGKEELEQMNAKLAKLNCPVNICNGYGQNEMCGAVTLNSNAANKNGSAGFPTIGSRIRIVDPETFETLGVHQQGLVLEQSESMFLCYDNMPKETEESKIQLKDGSVWFNTRDLGEMDEDGFLYILGRISRVLVRFDMKIFIDQIEEKIKSHSDVQDCAVVARKKDALGEEPVLFVSLKEECKSQNAEDILKDIQSGANALSDLEYPAETRLLSELPYMKNGKIDYLALEGMM